MIISHMLSDSCRQNHTNEEKLQFMQGLQASPRQINSGEGKRQHTALAGCPRTNQCRWSQRDCESDSQQFHLGTGMTVSISAP